MRVLAVVPTWLVWMFTGVMLVCFLIATTGLQGFGRDPFIALLGLIWTLLGCSELLRRLDWSDPPPRGGGGAPPYWP